MSADEKLVEALAEHLARRMFTEGRILDADGMPERWGDMPADQQRAWIKHVREITARPALEWLAERGRLTPDEAGVCDEYGTHGGVREHRQVITTPWEPAPEETNGQH